MEYFCILTVRFTENGVIYTKGISEVLPTDKILDTTQKLYTVMYGKLRAEYGFTDAETIHWSCDPQQLYKPPVRRQM